MELEGYQITAVHKSYSDVFFAKDEKTDENVVIKRFKERRGTLFDCVREMMFHQVLSSKYIEDESHSASSRRRFVLPDISEISDALIGLPKRML